VSAPHVATQTDAERAAAHASRKAADARRLQAEQEKVRGLERHVKRLESTIRTFLTADKVTEPQRAELVGLLAGLRPHARGLIDPKYAGITKPEQRLVDNYRAMSGNHARLMSGLAAELAKLDRLEEKKGGT